MEVAEVVLEPLDHGLNMIGLIPEISRTTITSEMMTGQDIPDVLPEPWSVNHSELGVGGVTQPRPLVCARVLGHGISL